MKKFPFSRFAAAALLMFTLGLIAAAQSISSDAAPQAAASPNLDDILGRGFTYRNLGPYRAGSWVACLAVPEGERERLTTMYVGTRNGGVWKTTNAGTTFEPVFEQATALTIGAIAVAPSDPSVVWVGSGEQSETRSSNPGDGVYKSTDAGKTWQKMGLADTQHIARITIDPQDPDIVCVAAMGHLFSTNEERGVFRTTDGGKTWKKVLYVDNQTGAIDLVMNRTHPEILYAAMFECLRFPWYLHDGGPGSGMYQSTDGGETWKKLGGGLPGGEIGRIGIDIYQKNPNILYAIVDNHNPYSGPPRGRGAGGGRRGGRRGARGRGADAATTATVPGSPRGSVAAAFDAATATTSTQTPRGGARGQSGAGSNWTGGQVYKTEDGGATWRLVSGTVDLSGKAGYSFNQLRIDTGNPDHVFVTSSNLQYSVDGGATFRGAGGGGGGGNDPDAFQPFQRAFGDYRSLWIDPVDPLHMIATSDGGVFPSYDGGRTCAHLGNLPLGEVYALCVDNEDPYNIYAGLQDHESWKGPSNGWSGRIGIEEWATVGQGDGMYNQVVPTDSRWLYNNQEFGQFARVDQNSRTRVITPPTELTSGDPLRWNWTSPIALSPHDPKTVYTGAQALFRSRDRGDSWEQISPDLTGNLPDKISPPRSSVQYCTLTTIAESPLAPGLIWTGSDDGKVQVKREGAAAWTDCTRAIAEVGGPEDAWVTRVVASRFNPAVAYVSKARHRQDDFRAFVFKTSDYGAHWTKITQGLPEKCVNVVFEDVVNPKLLFLGNDHGIYATLDAGDHWHSLRGNIPAVPIHDMTEQQREGDLVAGSYGRGLWILNIVPLREMSETTPDKNFEFYTPPAKGRRAEGAFGNYRLYGNQVLSVPNEPNGIPFTYYLRQPASAGVSIVIRDGDGHIVQTLRGPGAAGINQVVWNLAGFGGRGGLGGGGGAPPGEGSYRATLQIGGEKIERAVKVLAPRSMAEGRSIDENYNPDDEIPGN